MWGDVADWMRPDDAPQAAPAVLAPPAGFSAAPLLHGAAGPASAALWVPDGLPDSPTMQDLDALLLPQPVQPAAAAADSVPPLPWWPDSPPPLGAAATAQQPVQLPAQLPAAAMQPDTLLASMLALPTAAAGSGASSLGSFDLGALDLAALAGTTGGNSNACLIGNSPLQAQRAQKQQSPQQAQLPQQQPQQPQQQQCAATAAAQPVAQQQKQERRPLSPQACLFAAVKQRRHVLVRRLLDLGAPPNFCGVDVPLRCAAALAAAGIPVSGSEHLTPLMLAVQQLDAPCVELLLSHGAALQPGPQVGGGTAYCRPLLLQLLDAIAGATAGTEAAAATATAAPTPSAAVSGSSSDSGSGSITAACSSGSEAAGGGGKQPSAPNAVLAAARSVLEVLLQHGADPFEQDPHRPTNFLSGGWFRAVLRFGCAWPASAAEGIPLQSLWACQIMQSRKRRLWAALARLSPTLLELAVACVLRCMYHAAGQACLSHCPCRSSTPPA